MVVRNQRYNKHQKGMYLSKYDLTQNNIANMFEIWAFPIHVDFGKSPKMLIHLSLER